MRPRVLVTRPEPGAGATSRRLLARGFEPLVMPLSQTVALPFGQASLSETLALVAVTSPAALRLAPGGLLAGLLDRPLHAVGAATAEAARRAGFRTVIEGPGDAAGLADAILAAPPAGTVLYLAGRVRTPDFERRLGAAGIRVAPVEVYDTVTLAPGAAMLARLAEGEVTAALVHSTFAVAPLESLVRDGTGRNALALSKFLCLSPRIAAAFAPEFSARLRIAAAPTEAALLSLLGPAAPSLGGAV